MEVSKLKEYIHSNGKVEYVLDQIGCKYITKKDYYWHCANYNGDNRQAIVVYDNELLYCDNYTRDIKGNKNSSDIIDLVMYNKNLPFFKALKYLCDTLGIDYYDMSNDEDVPESLKLTQMLLDMNSGEYIDDDCKLRPISENILNYYKNYCNTMFENDNISYEVQKLFEIGYDDLTNHITIPIRDELGNLVGVKGRYFGEDYTNSKYIYLEKCARSRILFGLDKSYQYIKDLGYVYVGESEKFVMQMFNMGYKNSVSTGGKKISRQQKNKLASLGVRIVFVFDKDVNLEELKNIAGSFPDGVEINAIIDSGNLLTEKESPTDSVNKWEVLKNKEVELRKNEIQINR